MRNKKGFLLTFIIFDEKSLVLEKKACNTVFLGGNALDLINLIAVENA